ncbi:hypothetical protein [Blautia hydrogenotrophica]|uniref:hypothetical protein n=1 Tax=Blautia hydrogenotrophica TaxID=53443 RepID=UPI00248D7530|nr:hypothetical protein [Blautia hydrogenotrophica]
MKFHGGVNGGLLLLSLPLRGAWIEIRAGRSVGCEVIVAHREGSADGNSMSADRICLALRKSA